MDFLSYEKGQLGVSATVPLYSIITSFSRLVLPGKRQTVREREKENKTGRTGRGSNVVNKRTVGIQSKSNADHPFTT